MARRGVGGGQYLVSGQAKERLAAGWRHRFRRRRRRTARARHRAGPNFRRAAVYRRRAGPGAVVGKHARRIGLGGAGKLVPAGFQAFAAGCVSDSRADPDELEGRPLRRRRAAGRACPVRYRLPVRRNGRRSQEPRASCHQQPGRRLLRTAGATGKIGRLDLAVRYDPVAGRGTAAGPFRYRGTPRR